MQTQIPDPKKNWKNLITEQQKSASSVEDFCKKNVLRVNQFYYYKHKLFPTPKKVNPFVELITKTPVQKENRLSKIIISLNNISISFENDLDIDLVAELCLKLDGQR